MTEPTQSHSPIPSSGGGVTCPRSVEAAAVARAVDAAAVSPRVGWWSGLGALLGRFLPDLAGAFGLRPLRRVPEACPDIVRLRTKRLIRIVPLVADVPLDPALVKRLCDSPRVIPCVRFSATTPAGARQGLPRVIATDEAAS